MLDLNILLSHTDPFTGLITLTDATGINDSGQIVANGCYNDRSKYHAFFLTTASLNVSTDVPEPTSLTLLATGLAGSSTLGRRHQPVAETGEVTQKSSNRARLLRSYRSLQRSSVSLVFMPNQRE